MASSPSPFILTAQELTKSFDEETVLRRVSLGARRGELISIIGPSGCGKSTLLRCLNGLERADHGLITAKGVELHCGPHYRQSEQNRRAHRLRTHIGMVFQDFNLFSHLTVLDNILLAPRVVKEQCKDFSSEEAYRLLRKVGLETVAHRYPHALSGGQQQRAAIARALAMQPEIILYDEPTSALDPLMSKEVFDVMVELDRLNITQIIVTHNMRFARRASDRILFMKNGHILEEMTPHELNKAQGLYQAHHFMKDAL